MKFCSTCKEEFDDKFSFCPVDGTPLHTLTYEALEAKSEPIRGFETGDYNSSESAVPNKDLDIDPLPKSLRIEQVPEFPDLLEKLPMKNIRAVIMARLEVEAARAQIAIGQRSTFNLTGMVWLSLIFACAAVWGQGVGLIYLDPKLIAMIVSGILLAVPAMYLAMVRTFTKRFQGVTRN